MQYLMISMYNISTFCFGHIYSKIIFFLLLVEMDFHKENIEQPSVIIFNTGSKGIFKPCLDHSPAVSIVPVSYLTCRGLPDS